MNYCITCRHLRRRHADAPSQWMCAAPQAEMVNPVTGGVALAMGGMVGMLRATTLHCGPDGKWWEPAVAAEQASV